MRPTDPILDTLRRHGVTPSAELCSDLETLWSGRSPDVRTIPPRTWSSQPKAALLEGLSPADLPLRYQWREMLGSGGMGQVLSVYDQLLGRCVAMKIAHSNLSSASRSRFLAEAQVVAQLQHPGIVPVYDLGRLPSGADYFTMAIVRGRTLGDVIRKVHQTPSAAAEEFTLQRLLWSFQQVCDAIGYAHARGVVHRDLKPENIIVGEHGETVVVDWGLAKVLDLFSRDDEVEVEDDPVLTARMSQDTSNTLAGAIIGTIGYMPPEQARGDHDRVDRRADVHALGATLYEILSNTPLYAAPERTPARFSVLNPVFELQAPPSMPPDVPDELKELVYACIERDPGRRPPDAECVARAMASWFEGAHRREKALGEVQEADRWLWEIERMRAESASLLSRAEQLLNALPSRSPAESKREGWRMQDKARRAAKDADMLEIRWVEALSAALRTDPSSSEAHERLARHFRIQHARAEASADPKAAELLQRLQTHDIHNIHHSYLDGAGAVTVISDPPGANAVVSRYVERDRRLVLEPFGPIGNTPICDVALPMGSYCITLALSDHAAVQYPVYIERCGRWTGHPPDESAPRSIPLPQAEQLAPGECYVPPGCFVAGGDPVAEWPRARAHVWVDGFIIRRHPVTNREFIAFLDDLVARGRQDEALRHQPRYEASIIYGRDEDGRFVLQRDSDGDLWLPDMPVVLIDWYAAAAYARWEADRSHLPWRLPWELEWEKAARGTDGRRFPWGDHFDDSWCGSRDSLEQPMPQPISAFPTDLSPYGVRGCAGNVHDWCLDRFHPDGPVTASEPPPEPAPSEVCAVRGGAWHAGTRWTRCASRGASPAQAREAVIGFRLARSFP